MTKNIELAIFSIIIGLTGLGIIVIYTNWQTALGIFLFIWSQNITFNTKL